MQGDSQKVLSKKETEISTLEFDILGLWVNKVWEFIPKKQREQGAYSKEQKKKNMDGKEKIGDPHC